MGNIENDRVRHQFAEPQEFRVLLNDATTEASGEWAEQFCKDMNDRFDRYGAESFLTHAQLSKLREIAEARVDS